MTTEHWVTVTFLLFTAFVTVAIVGIVLLRQRDKLRWEREYWWKAWTEAHEQLRSVCKSHHQALDDAILQKEQTEDLREVITGIRRLCDGAVPPGPPPPQSATPSPRPSAHASGR